MLKLYANILVIYFVKFYNICLFVKFFYFIIPFQTASRVTLTHDFGFVALDLAYVKPEDSGTYTCKATNELGQAVCSATLTVKGETFFLEIVIV